MQSLISKLSVKLIFNQLKLVTVESCTGGWIGKEVTAVAGSSAWYEGGFITYSNLAKQNMVNVSAKTLKKYGAVSEEVAVEMVQGACELYPNSAAISVTGIAGPDGGSNDKPVGTVCIAVNQANNLKVRRFQFDGNRTSVREQTVTEALKLLLSINFARA